MEKTVLFEIDNSVAVITLNRPERRNAINQELLCGLYDSLDRVREDVEVKAAVITGSGKAFCAGIDLDCLGTDNLFDPRGDGRDLPDLFSRCHKPIIGAVNGYAITGGFELALNCDFLIASDNASFADTHSVLGIHPGWGMTQLLQEAVGMRRAKQYSLTGQFMTAGLAYEYGLVNEVVELESLLPRAMEIAGQICATRIDTMNTVKELMENRYRMSLSDALDAERKGFARFARQLKNFA